MCLLSAGAACYFPPPYTVPAAAGIDAVGQHAAVADLIVAESNRVRAEAGVDRLVGDDALHLAAQEYAVELARRGVLDHKSPTTGKGTMVERLDAVGANYTLAGENLARITVYEPNVSRETIDLWMRSDGHRRNMLTRSFTSTGVGVSRDRRGDWFVVQLYTRAVRGPR